MNITDIAKLAKVSVSTVSKVMNGKDQTISDETRKRVLDIAKKHNYSPYSSIISAAKKTFNLAFAAANNMDNMLIFKGILQASKERGYSVTFIDADEASDGADILSAASGNADAVIMDKSRDQALKSNLNSKGINFPVLKFSYSDSARMNAGIDKISYFITRSLHSLGHRDIVPLCSKSCAYSEPFYSGYSKYMFENLLPQPGSCEASLTDELLSKIASHNISAIICSDYKLCLDTYIKLKALNYSIPEDISLICAVNGNDIEFILPEIAAVVIPFEAFGCCMCNCLIDKLEKRISLKNAYFELKTPNIVNPQAVGIPFAKKPKKALVIGSINVDNYLFFDELPTSGTTVRTDTYSFYPGGKATNTAVGLSRLGETSEVIGAVGFNSDADIIFNALLENNVIYENLARYEGVQTGKAYIFVDKKGESVISMLSGANSMMDTDYIKKNESSFESSAYCIISTEIPIDVVRESLLLAKKHGATTILKPSSLTAFDENLLSLVDIFVPNRTEFNEFCKEVTSTEEKLDKIISLGVKTVILTLGSNGCILKTNEKYRHFAAADFTPIDNTGACDAFISALTAYLIKDYDIESAIRIATYAAGFSITREGVIPSLIDKNTLEAYIKMKENGLIKVRS